MSEEESGRMVTSEYWDGRYAEVASDNQVHEWFKSFADIEPFLEENFMRHRGPDTPTKILHLGSGDSTIPLDLWARGYRAQLCVDFSPIIVERMSKRHATAAGGIEWKCMDVRDMDQISSGSIDVAFDKGTMDAMIHGNPWSPPDDVLENTGRYIREVYHVLKTGGSFLYVTYRQPHFMKPLLNCEGTDWNIEVVILNPPSGSFEYYGFVLKKASSADEPKESD